MTPQPAQYRIRLYRKNREVTDYDQRFVAVLDFNPGPGLWATKGQLDAIVQSMAWANGARGEDTLQYHLAVHQALTDELVCNWPATNWHNPT